MKTKWIKTLAVAAYLGAGGSWAAAAEPATPAEPVVFDALEAERLWIEARKAGKPAWMPGCPPENTPYIWKSQPPEGCPFPLSERFGALCFTGRGRPYMSADTWYPTWAADGNLYAPAADGVFWADSQDGLLSERVPATWDQGYWKGAPGMGSKEVLSERKEARSSLPARASSPGEILVEVGCRAKFTRTGNAVMVGDDPLDLTLKATYMPYTIDDMTPWFPYPSGCLHHKGVWYYSIYGLQYEHPSFGPYKEAKTPLELKLGVSERHGNGKIIGPTYSVLGPMSTFRISKDYGKTWIPYPTPSGEPQDPAKAPWDARKMLFPETRDDKWLLDYYKTEDKAKHQLEHPATVKFGAPHFVDFGKDMEHSPDGKAYLVGMGGPADTKKWRPADVGWISADQIFLGRVTLDPKRPEAINDLKNWEFFGGRDASGKAVWVGDFSKIQPLLEWDDKMGCVTISYNAPLKTYLMCVTAGWPPVGPKDLYILESERIEGPWKLVTYMRNFGPSNYFVNIPTKFISADGKTFWLIYSNNRTLPVVMPRQSTYGAAFVEVKLPEKKP